MNRTRVDRVVQEGSTLVKLDAEPINRNDLQSADPLFLLIHGFTAHGTRLEQLGSRICAWCVNENSFPHAAAVVFNYNSFSGIEAAARTLGDRLLSYCPPTRDGASDISILRNKIVILSHSMGGLVARQFAARYSSLVKGVVMLGTPNDGVSTDAMLDLLVTIAETVSDSPLPNLRVKSNLSRKQLTKKDGPPGRRLLDRLSSEWSGLPSRPRTMTISGANPVLRLSSNAFFDSAINLKIQRLMAGATNDGLVTELSVDMNASVFTKTAPEYVHLNDYAEYHETNHSHLVDNEHLARLIYNWVLEGDLVRTRTMQPMHDQPDAA